MKEKRGCLVAGGLPPHLRAFALEIWCLLASLFFWGAL